MANSISSEGLRSAVPESSSQLVRRVSVALIAPDSANKPKCFIRLFRAVFGYRKASLTFLVLATLVTTVLVAFADNSLEFSVDLPSSDSERITLDYSWLVLQEISKYQHTYTSKHNDEVHDYLQDEIRLLIDGVPYAESDNDLNYTNNIIVEDKYLSYASLSYYESNNILVRINGSDASLPALLLSSHFDSVPSAFGTTDDGMGVASMMGVLQGLCGKDSVQPDRTIIFNFNNNEEFGLYGAKAFLMHPWAAQVKYFLNLEGTGAGGKAVLFRGSDYGIISHFGAVRYPYGNSIFQQGFSNGLIHSETDYFVYRNLGGLRGLDLAFFKPRDIYHTAQDNIRNTNRKSLWHMLSSTIDFTAHMTEGEIDLDAEHSGKGTDFAAYFSFINFFFCAPVLLVVLVNIVLLVVAPVAILLLLSIVIYQNKGWDANFVNVVKYPLSLVFSVSALSFGIDVVLMPLNPFVANNSVGTLVFTLFSVFLLLNYCFLNLYNLVFKSFKGHQHDEKLVLLLESTLLLWVILLWSTVKLLKNAIGDDHTGEAPVTVLFGALALASLLGLLGWTFQKSKRSKTLSRSGCDYLSLVESLSAHYGASDNSDDCSSLSLNSRDIECMETHRKGFSYDWLIQFVAMVPVSSFVIYNWGFLAIDAFHKSIQESMVLQGLVYKFLQIFVVAWAIPFMPFIFKLNRSIVLVFIACALSGILVLGIRAPFDAANPIKLRFLETIHVASNSVLNLVTVSARLSPMVMDILSDMPSVKRHGYLVQEQRGHDGMLVYCWNSTLMPHVVPGVDSVEDYVKIDVLKNSSTSSDAPLGILTGELRITALKNRNCKLTFKNSDSIVNIAETSTFDAKETYSPVKTVIVYDNKKPPIESHISGREIPDGFSKDVNGNYLFKSSQGIRELQLNKLDWDSPYHLLMQWSPKIVDSILYAGKISVLKLGIDVECYWSELSAVSDGRKGDFLVFESIPAYQEVLHYSPNYVSWANRDRGIVSVQRYVEI